MRKLNLANLAKDELKQDEAQKVKAGLFCYCTCSCNCPPRESAAINLEDQRAERRITKNS